MTFHLADVASYQGAISIKQIRAAGFGVNIKVSHGLGQKSVHPAAGVLAVAARAAGMRVSTFHWLTADATGEAQADYAYGRLRALGLEAGTAHQLDVEAEPAPTLASVRGYLTRMTALLGRPVVLYTGDWWWTRQRAWNVSDLTPYLWAAPNAGYLGSYPGDGSEHWRAGYGGWANLTVMQYAVKTLPGTSIKVSMSAVRDESAWLALTGGRPAVSYAPDSIMAARKLVMDTLRAAGETVVPASFGVVGDDSHANAGTGYHLGKDALKSSAYSIVESSRDRSGLTNAVAGFDWGNFSIVVRGKRHDLKSMSLWMVAQCKAGAPDTKDIREIIYSPDGQTVKRWDRLGIRTTGDSSHTSHTHFSWFRDSEKRDKTALFRRYFISIGLIEGEDDMPSAEDVAKETVKQLLDGPIIAADNDTNYGSLRGNIVTLRRRTDSTEAILKNQSGNLNSLIATVGSLAGVVGVVLANVQADDGDRAALESQLRQVQNNTAAAAAQAVRDAFGAGSPDDVAAALRAALGADKAAAVGALLRG